MSAPLFSRAIRDRIDDPCGADERPGRRAVVTRSSQRRFWVLCLLLVFYGTLGPVGISAGPWVDPAASWSWQLPWLLSDYNDVLTNTLVFIPVGASLRLLMRRRRRAGWTDLTAGVLLAALLSYAAEWAQQFMPSRSANLMDVGVNTVGAALGAIAAPALQRIVRSVHGWAYETMFERPWTVAATALTAMAAILTTVPWDLGWSPPRFDLLRALNGEDAQRVGLFFLLGYAYARSRQSAGHPAFAAGVRAALAAAALALGAEAAQLLLRSHTPDALDALLSAIAGATGAAGAVGMNLLGRRRCDGRFRIVLVVLIGAVLFGLGDDLFHVAQRGPLGPAATFIVAPFSLHFGEPFAVALTDIVQTALLASIVTGLALAVGGGRAAGPALGAMLAVCWIHLSFKWLFGHPGDLTPVLVVFGGWLVTVRIHRNLTERGPLHASRTFA